MSERKLGVCKLSFRMQVKSTANITRFSMESTKWMFFYQSQNRTKCCVCCVGGRCVCCEHCSCLYIFAWTPANQTSTQKEGRWIMGNCIIRTCPWQVWKEMTVDIARWESPHSFWQRGNSRREQLVPEPYHVLLRSVHFPMFSFFRNLQEGPLFSN